MSRLALSFVLVCHELKGFVYVVPNGDVTYEGMVSAHTSWILISALKTEITMNVCGLFGDWVFRTVYGRLYSG
jgi:hypothetical protein